MGQHEYRLKSLADDELLVGLSNIVGRRNQITAEFLAYLAELDQRQLFLDLGFASLFAYCVEALGLCESTAGRRIAAARVCRNHPEVFGLVASGALHTSALSINDENCHSKQSQSPLLSIPRAQRRVSSPSRAPSAASRLHPARVAPRLVPIPRAQRRVSLSFSRAGARAACPETRRAH
jgi:hypothetical protein